MKSVIAALVVTASVAFATGPTPIPSQALNALTTIDIVPTKQQIDKAFGNEQDALDNLAALATNNDVDPEPNEISVRLRAIHALAKYCSATPCATADTAHQAVAAVIPATRDATTGYQVLVLRAAIETLGTMRVSTDVTTLVPLLEHQSRDIRAATARALRDLCNAQAITALRTRYAAETTDQVKLAISEALRILGQCSANQ